MTSVPRRSREFKPPKNKTPRELFLQELKTHTRSLRDFRVSCGAVGVTDPASVRIYSFRCDAHRSATWTYIHDPHTLKRREREEERWVSRLQLELAKERQQLEVTLCSPELPQEVLGLVAELTELVELAEFEAWLDTLVASVARLGTRNA
jgi:hypothetical protein